MSSRAMDSSWYVLELCDVALSARSGGSVLPFANLLDPVVDDQPGPDSLLERLQAAEGVDPAHDFRVTVTLS